MCVVHNINNVLHVRNFTCYYHRQCPWLLPIKDLESLLPIVVRVMMQTLRTAIFVALSCQKDKRENHTIPLLIFNISMDLMTMTVFPKCSLYFYQNVFRFKR